MKGFQVGKEEDKRGMGKDKINEKENHRKIAESEGRLRRE